MIQAVALIACLCVSDEGIGGHLDLIKKIGNSFNIIEAAKYETEIDKALESIHVRNKDVLLYLEYAKKDIRIFKSLDGAKLLRIKEIMKDVNEISNECISKKVENSKINQIITEVKELVSFFGDLSYVDLNMTIFLFTLKQMNDKTNTFTKELDEEVQRFQKSFWKNSFFLDQLILSQVENHMRQGEYQLSYTLSLKSLKMREQLCGNPEDPFILSPMAYKFKSLVGLKEYGRIIQDFKNIPLSLIELNDRGYQFIISEICSSVAKAYFETNKVDLCVVYQELAVSKIYSIAFDRKHPFVQKEAIILQTYLAKKGDWAAVRTLEERYELKPLPKDAKEK